jgi:hypothetical protein
MMGGDGEPYVCIPIHASALLPCQYFMYPFLIMHALNPNLMSIVLDSVTDEGVQGWMHSMREVF